MEYFALLEVLIHALSINVLLFDNPLQKELSLLLHFHHALHVGPQFLVVLLELSIFFLELFEFVVYKHLKASELCYHLWVCIKPLCFRIFR